jgi:DNA-binding CsgD family transcriptional regulator
MSRLKEKEIADFFDCLRDIYSITDIGTFGEKLISRLRKVLDCPYSVFGSCDLRSMRLEFITDHPDACNLPLQQILTNLPRDHQHPYWQYYLKTRDPQATKLSDFMSRREFHSKGFYTEAYKPLKVEAEIGCMLVIAPHAHLIYIASSRDRGDFSERDRFVLNLLQPHLAQAYRNARAFTDLREEVSLARRIVESLDHAVIVLSQNGSVRFMTERARSWLDEYFGTRRRADELPEVFENWIKHQNTSLGSKDNVPGPLRPFISQREGKKLLVRLIPEGHQTILVLEEERTSVDPQSLEPLGLTRREAEVSAWVAEGKTNAEIGQILRAHPLTVKKHLEHIFQKLGVENRTTAARLVLDQQKKAKT